MSHTESQGKLSWLCVLAVAACGNRDRDSAPELSSALASSRVDQSTIALNGAGATFPYPLYSRWISAYNRLRPNIKINYQSIGSGGGIRQMAAGTVDFGATDVPMTAEESAGMPHRILHIPTSLGAVAVTYHLEDTTAPLRLSPESLSAIYLGKIRKWNAAEIVADNPGIKLPPAEIAVVYRSDGSGTTAIFTEYLAQVSSDFRNAVGQGKNVKWPIGLGAKGSEGVTGQVRAIPNAIGYVEHLYAVQNGLPTAQLKNTSGFFVGPSAASTSAAAEGIVLDPNGGASLTNAKSEQAYPITTLTYLLVNEHLDDQRKGQALADFIWWALHDGQNESEVLGYAPLPSRIVATAESRLKQLRIGDRKALAVH